MRRLVFVVVALVALAGCRRDAAPSVPRASGYVEATETRIAAKVPGRVVEVKAVEGARVEAGQTLVTLSTTDIDLALRQVRAERAQAEAQRRLLLAGSRPEDVQQAEAQAAAAASDRKAAEAELASA